MPTPLLIITMENNGIRLESLLVAELLYSIELFRQSTPDNISSTIFGHVKLALKETKCTRVTLRDMFFLEKAYNFRDFKKFKKYDRKMALI